MTEFAERMFDPEESVSGNKVSSPAPPMRAVRIHRFGGVLRLASAWNSAA
jgi:hypothetical protein